ncbi:hypothetical protein L2Y94_10385 [Luteibacter aegosomatis]|uniref:hypothetical protein n=1 Tax=Luteibacter aegosomatis TaxID=2911537 RepID=UPI001FF84487|nr:hypothetical protein [Luteibacter aegosomatis]UPG87736.1 hypothetical protein L2Y94_10385 [Luteibacter aegosomatis]
MPNTSHASPQRKHVFSGLYHWKDPKAKTLADEYVDLAPPLVEGLVDQTIPLSAYEEGLNVTIPLWSPWPGDSNVEPGPKDEWQILFNDEVADDDSWTAVGEPPAAVKITIPPERLKALPEGEIVLRYVIATVPADTRGEGRLSIVKDTLPPGGRLLGPIVFAADLVENGLSSEKLTDLGNILKGDINDFYRMEEGDIVHPFIIYPDAYAPSVEFDELVEAGTAVQGNVYVIKQDDIDKKNIELEFTRAQLETLDTLSVEGQLIFAYYVVDKIGNRSINSPATYLKTLLKDAPSELKPPVIDLFSDDGIINEGDARTPITVKVPSYTNVRNGDAIEVYWGDERVAQGVVDGIDEAAPGEFILEPEVSYGDLQRVPERYTVDVTYKAFRFDIATTSPPLEDVLVDLTIPGGPDPKPGTPINENLVAPTVQGAVTTDPNVINPPDTKQPATATIPGTTVDDEDAFAEDDRIQLYWNGVAEGPVHTVLATEVGADIPLTVAPETLAASSGDVPVHYTASRDVDDGQGGTVENTALSPTQIVKVFNDGDLPGGPEGLGDGEFTEANRFNAINLAAAQSGGGTPFVTPAYINKKLGDVMTLTFVQYVTDDGTGVPIEESRYEPTHVVGPDDVGKEYEFLIPTDNLLLASGTVGHSARASYHVKAANGLEATSDETFVLIDLR